MAQAERWRAPGMDAVVTLLRAKWTAKAKTPHTSPETMAMRRAYWLGLGVALAYWLGLGLGLTLTLTQP